MEQVRVNLTLDEDVWAKFIQLVPKRKKSRIINELLKGEVDRIRRRQEEQALTAAFREAAEDQERLAVIQEWESLDAEGWKEKP